MLRNDAPMDGPTTTALLSGPAIERTSRPMLIYNSVHELRQKVRISAHAIIGPYWFSSFDLYGDR